jgi:hypothetical protein
MTVALESSLRIVSRIVFCVVAVKRIMWKGLWQIYFVIKASSLLKDWLQLCSWDKFGRPSPSQMFRYMVKWYQTSVGVDLNFKHFRHENPSWWFFYFDGYSPAFPIPSILFYSRISFISTRDMRTLVSFRIARFHHPNP